MSRRVIALVILFVAVLDFIGCAKNEPTKPPVYATIFADPNLDRVVRQYALKPEGDLTAADVEHITELSAIYAHITDLTGIEYMTSLHWLKLEGNSITSFAPLSALTLLDTLSLSGNVTDLSPLASLTNLRWLLFDGVEGGDFGALSALTQLQYVRLWECDLSDCAFLGNMTSLRDLILQDDGNLNDISGVSALSRLVHLSLIDLPVQSVSGIASCDSLSVLSLNRLYNLSDITALAGLTNLDTLYLVDLSVTDWTPIASLNNLVELRISCDFHVSDLSPFANLTRLTSLRIDPSAAPTLPLLSGLPALSELVIVNSTGGWRQLALNCEFLAPLSHLQALYLGNMQIDNLSTLGTVTSLRRLVFYEECAIPNYSDLSALTRLTYLSMGYAPEEWPILNLDPIDSLTSLDTLVLTNAGLTHTNLGQTHAELTYIDFSNNHVEGVDGFATQFPNIATLKLAGNQITAVNTLLDNQIMGAGDLLDLRDNPLSDHTRNTIIPLLQSYGVTVLY